MHEVAEEVFENIRRAFDEHPIDRKRFIDRWRDTADWPASYRQATRRLAQWLDLTDPHRFPVEALPDLIRTLGHARFLDPLLALEQRVQREHRARSSDGGRRERERRRTG